MSDRFKLIALILFLVVGGILVLSQPAPEGRIGSSWNCAGSRSLFCIQK